VLGHRGLTGNRGNGLRIVLAITVRVTFNSSKPHQKSIRITNDLGVHTASK
jgi:hypothetical protein